MSTVSLPKEPESPGFGAGVNCQSPVRYVVNEAGLGCEPCTGLCGGGDVINLLADPRLNGHLSTRVQPSGPPLGIPTIDNCCVRQSTHPTRPNMATSIAGPPLNADEHLAAHDDVFIS